MTPLTPTFWNLSPTQFRCHGCNGQEAYRSRPRGFFEAYVLPIVYLQPVRCDRCYLRSYVPRSISIPDPPHPRRLRPQGTSTVRPGEGSRIA